MPLATEISRVATDAGLLHSIVHGASTAPDVVTEGGAVKPVAKVVAEAAAAMASLNTDYPALTTTFNAATSAINAVP